MSNFFCFRAVCAGFANGVLSCGCYLQCLLSVPLVSYISSDACSHFGLLLEAG